MIAAGVGQQARNRPRAAGDGKTLGPAFICRTIGRPCPCAEILADLQEIGRVLGGEGDGAGDAVRTIQGRCGAAQDLDRLDHVQVVIVAATDRLGAEAEAAGQAHPVVDDQHAVAAHAANGEARIAVATAA